MGASDRSPQLCVVLWLFRAEAGLGQCLVIVRANVRRLRMSCDADALLRDRRVCVVTVIDWRLGDCVVVLVFVW